MTRIDRDVLHELWCEAKRTGQPITAVVQAAVNEHLNRRLDASFAQPAPAAASPSSASAA
jgi:hypothetical protein